MNSKAIYLKGQVLKRILYQCQNCNYSRTLFLPLLTYCRTARYFCKASDRRKMEKKSCAIQRKEQPITKVSKKDNKNPATLLHC